MKKNEVKIRGVYTAKVSDRLVPVRIDGIHSGGGWQATNTATGKRIRIKSARRLRGPVADGQDADLVERHIDREGHVEAMPENRDPDRCATERCKGKPAVTHMGRPLCKPCWERICAKEDTQAQATIDATDATPTDEPADAKRSRKPKDAGNKPKRTSALDAAADVLRDSGKPMRSRELIAAMAEQDLWKSPNGKTPHATLYAAMLREIGAKGDQARFRRAERGRFEYAGGAA